MRAFILLIAVVLVATLDNGLGKTPPMGWNSWNRFGCNINETLIRKTADQLVSTGLAGKGYKYLNLDDCWQLSRNSTTNEIQEDRGKFPSGMPSLGEYIHDKGLLFGLYSSAGTYTCEKRPGSLGYETIDAITYAKWKVDYLKYDNCYNQKISSRERYPTMRDALNATGRPIFYSMCQWGEEQVYVWAKPVGNSWRTTGDIQNNYKSMVAILDQQVSLSRYSSPGAWNDPDMLEVGNGLMTNDEYQSHFALWAALKAPLLIGCNLDGITEQTLAILGNDEVIAVNQDPLGRQADLNKEEKGDGYFRQIWSGLLSDDRYVFICFNRGDTSTEFTLDLEYLLPTVYPISARQIISHTDVQIADRKITTGPIRTHASKMYVVKFKQ